MKRAMSALLCVAVVACGSNGPTNVEGFVMCQEFVRDQLRAPGTASFPFGSDDYTTRTGNRFEVNAYVDAENSFGGEVREHFRCVVVYNPADESWTLESLDFS